MSMVYGSTSSSSFKPAKPPSSPPNFWMLFQISSSVSGRVIWTPHVTERPSGFWHGLQDEEDLSEFWVVNPDGIGIAEVIKVVQKALGVTRDSTPEVTPVHVFFVICPTLRRIGRRSLDRLCRNRG